MKPADHRAVMASRQDTAFEDADFFPTPPWAARVGGELIKRLDPVAASAWEPACGAGHMVHGLRGILPAVHASDAYLYDGNAIHDFVADAGGPAVDWIVTNPPFALIEPFVRRAYSHARRGVAMLMRAGVLESEGRYPLLYGDCPLTVFAPFSERVPMHKGRWESDGSTAAFYAWFIWLKPALRPRRFMARVGDSWYPATLPIAPGQKKRLTHRSDIALSVNGKAAAVRARLTAEGLPVGGPLFELLAKVAREGGARGVTPHSKAYPGGLLATLKTMGLLEHAPALDALDDRRFRPSADGRVMLAEGVQ